MLFRSEQLSLWGLDVFRRFVHWGDRLGAWAFRMNVLPAPFVGFAVRLIATVYWLLRQPISTLTEMPGNWIRQSLCTDFLHPAELLPLEAAKGNDRDHLPFVVLVRVF